MENTAVPELLRKFEIPGRVAVAGGNGGLTKINITTGHSTAEIYLHGAHITRFQKNGEPPLLFLSRVSRFAAGEAVRGGVPICFPWFGRREDGVSHGFARTMEWNLTETVEAPNGGVTVRFRLPFPAAAAAGTKWQTEFVVTVTEQLVMELIVANESADRNFDFENCLHTYFAVGDIAQVSLAGLERAPFLDYAFGAGGARRKGDPGPLRITQETNRVYPDAAGTVEIRDEKIRRIVRVEKFNSRSTVVWNPWTTQKLPDDFDPAEHRQMLCVESGNVKQNQISLPPGKTTTLKVVLSSHPL